MTAFERRIEMIQTVLARGIVDREARCHYVNSRLWDVCKPLTELSEMCDGCLERELAVLLRAESNQPSSRGQG